MEDSQALAGNLGTIAKVITSLFNQVQAAPSHLLCILALFALGIFLKRSPIPNILIPWILIGLGTVLYPALVSARNIDNTIEEAWIVLALFGSLLGAGAIALHVVAKKSEKYRTFEAGLMNAFRSDDQQKENNEK